MKSDSNIVDKAVKLSLVEVVLGSLIHALHIPLGGQVLSLNQGFMLTRFLDSNSNRISNMRMILEVSIVASLMKSLAPIGKKLGPMISISTQGFLYMLGIGFLGNNIFGQILGMILLSPWAFVQPLVTYYVIYGSDFTSALNYFADKNELIYNVITYVILGKAVLAGLIPVLLSFVSEGRIKAFEDKIQRLSIPKKSSTQSGSAFEMALRELFRPMFIISIVFMVLFFYVSGEDAIGIFWKIMRAIAIALILFYITRSPFVLRKLESLAKRNRVFKRLYELSESAAKAIANS